jgi:hypothetical protein
MNNLFGKYPAEVVGYNPSTKRARVKIKGVTDGSSLLPEADIMYSVGDKNNHTDVRILVGDKVWVEFTNGGDSRFPLIVGYRNPESGNATGTRKWHHDAFEITADGVLTINADSVVINATSFEVNGDTKMTGKAVIEKSVTMSGGSAISGGASISGTLTNNGKNVGDSHTHKDSQNGQTSPPI